MRDQYWNPDPWRILFPARHLRHVVELKEAYIRFGAHGVNGLCGIKFADEWPTIGQKFTYDIVTRTWDR